jgi:hypothetical protein
MKYWIPCELSEKWNTNPLRRNKRRVNGHIIGESYDKTCWYVTWGGSTNRNNGHKYHKSFINIVDHVIHHQTGVTSNNA